MSRRVLPGDAVRLRLAAKLGLFLASLGAAVSLGILIGTREFLKLAVNGPAYRTIAQAKELADDFSPAPQFIDVPFVAADEFVDMAANGDRAGMTKAILVVRTSRAEYTARRDRWRRRPPSDTLLNALMERAARPALAFFDAFDHQLLPAVDRHDFAGARRIREDVLDSLFRDHESVVRDLERHASADVQRQEDAAAAQAALWSFVLPAVGLLSIVLLFILAWYMLRRSVLQPLQRAVAYMSAIGRGQYDLKVDVTRRDEIGDMLVALDAMRGDLQRSSMEARTARERAEVSEERFALAMRGTNEGLWEVNLATGSGYMSERWFAILGYDPSELEQTYAAFVSLLHPDDVALMQNATEDYFAGRTKLLQVEFRLRHKDGHFVPVLTRAVVSHATDGRLTRLVGTILDLTELHRVRGALNDAERKYSDIVEHSPEGIYQTTLSGQPLMVNRACARLFGFEETTQLMGSEATAVDLYVDPQRRSDFLHLLQKNGSVVGFAARMRRRDGSIIWTSNSARVVRDDEGKVKYIEGFVEDITDRQAQEETILHLATHDPLTDLPNRRAINESLGRAGARAQRGETSAFLLIDLDNFKTINDSVGHPAGDRFLQSIGPLFKRVLRPADTLARFGGDEFAILLEDVTPRRTLGIAERLREAISEFRFQEGGYTFAPTASIGIAMIETDVPSASIVSIADAALHAAKDQGKNRCVVYQALTEREARLTEASQWAARIKDALRENRLLIHFQPIVRLSDGGTVSYEALVRMREADGTIINPGAFIPAAERFGLASAIDEWVVKSVLDTLRRRPAIRVCVNLSGASLGDEMLLQRIERSLAGAEEAARRVIFEITETSVVQDLIRARHWMERLSRLGCHFALDDFGIGFSSFSYLRSLPVDEVKIDGSFIRTIGLDSTSDAVVSAITTLSHALGKQVIAEWVEDEVTATRLASLGVDYGQGYLWSLPVDLDQEPEGVSPTTEELKSA